MKQIDQLHGLVRLPLEQLILLAQVVNDEVLLEFTLDQKDDLEVIPKHEADVFDVGELHSFVDLLQLDIEYDEFVVHVDCE